MKLKRKIKREELTLEIGFYSLLNIEYDFIGIMGSVDKRRHCVKGVCS